MSRCKFSKKNPNWQAIRIISRLGLFAPRMAVHSLEVTGARPWSLCSAKNQPPVMHALNMTQWGFNVFEPAILPCARCDGRL